jgi:hypothetical protein
MAYAYSARITIDKTKVGETDADFALPIVGTYDGTDGEPDLRTVANGGHIQNTASGGASGALTVPADLVFGQNEDGSNPYNFEVESYDPATGEIVAHVQCGVDTGADTVLYMVYGDPSVTISQENVAGTWDTHFKGVWHLGETSGTFYDSTTNSNDGTDHVSAAGKDGEVGAGQEFDGADDYIDCGNGASLSPSVGGALTVETWADIDADASWDNIVDRRNANDDGYILQVSDTEHLWVRLFEDSTSDTIAYDSGQEIASGWHHIAFTADLGSATGLKVYYDGSQVGTTQDLSAISDLDVSANLVVGKHATSAANYYNGNLDEVRVSMAIRSQDYITTCYNSQGSPGTFYSVGAEQEAIAAQPYAFIM